MQETLRRGKMEEKKKGYLKVDKDKCGKERSRERKEAGKEGLRHFRPDV